MRRRSRSLLAALIAAGLLSSPAVAAEVIFKGSAIGLSEPFLCGGLQPAGKYDMAVSFEPKPQERSTLIVSKEGRTLCEVEGSVSAEKLETSKVRVFTKVNKSVDAIQIDLLMPSEARSRFSNQVFYLPLSKD